MIRPLRQRLFVQFTLVAAVPFLLAGLAGLLWFYPYLQRDIAERQEQLALTLTNELDTYLKRAGETVLSVAALPLGSALPPDTVRHILDAQARNSEVVHSLYILDRRGTVTAVGLLPENELQRPDLLGLDLSRNRLRLEVAEQQQPLWSDIYLSIIGGGLTVAFAAPADSGQVVVGEVDLVKLSRFLRSISMAGNQLVLVIDGNGQVIADKEGRYTAQQLNLNNVPLVRDGVMLGQNRSGALTFEGRQMLGQLVHAPYINWHVLVAQPRAEALRPLHLTVGLLSGALFAALLVGIGAALNMARSLSRRFERLANHAREVKEGTAAAAWPPANIREFNDLATDLRQMSEAIHERERQLATLMSNLPGMVHRCQDDESCRLLFASHGTRALTGYSGEELVARGVSLKELIHPDDREQATAGLRTAIAAGRPYEQVFRIVPRDGNAKWVWALGQGVEIGDKRVVEGFISDISVRVRAEMELREALQRAEAANQAKSTFLANMSHELRTPLNGILGMLQLLERATPLDAQQQEYTHLATTCGWNLLRLLDDLLDLSRIESGRLELREEPTAVAALAGEVLQLFRLTAEEKGLELSCSHGPELPERLLLDPVRVRQIILNLVGNAVKFTHQGTVRLQLAFLPGREAGSGWLKIVVSDTGIGMDAALQQRIFEPFTQGEESYQRTFQGAGLGLGIVKRLVELMQGSIAVSSAPGAGTTMSVTIAATVPPVITTFREDAMPADTSAPQPGSGLRLLLVEDNADNQRMLRLMLETDGHQVDVADNGVRAIEALRRQRYDLVLMDIQMPELDGMAATRLIRADRSGDFDPNIPVVAITAYATTSDREKVMAAGVDDYLAKPVRWHDLRATIKRRLPAATGDKV